MSKSKPVKLATITISEIGDEISVSTKFAESIPVGTFFEAATKTIQALVETARRIGNARGMSNDEVDDALFGK